jgi:hypothetical protein
MSRAATVASIALAVVAYPVAASASAVTFIDSAFNLADYTESPLYASGMNVLYIQNLTYGPCCALEIVGASYNTVSSSALAFINTNFSYDPAASGAITSLSASVDKDLVASALLTGFGNTFHPTIEQGGNFYVASIPGPSLFGISTGYKELAASGLTAADFQEYDFSTHEFVAGNPDFSGGLMEFGLTQLFTINDAPGLSARALYNNLEITLNTTPAITVSPTPSIAVSPTPPITVNPPAAIPEASSWAMMLLGFAGLGFVGYLKARPVVSTA